MQKIGILGGGQLGRMLLQAAANYPVETFVMEKDPECPAAHLCHHFTKGDIKDFDAVYNFGKGLDAITIEIENVNVEALEKLELEGVKVIPKPKVLNTIRNKILQKQYYQQFNIPTPEFIITNNREELKDNMDFLPAVHKLAMGGYDGRGVQIFEVIDDFKNGFNVPAILEKKIDIEKEIAQIIAINEKGEAASYPPVEMHFDTYLNLLDYQLCPPDIDDKILNKAEVIALAVVRNFQSQGIYAVEMFVDKLGNVFVNETAPRVHNSGHHTIEAHFSSQFDMLWRILLGYELGNTEMKLPSVMVNIVGGDGFTGLANYEGINDVLKMKNSFIHIYGKKQTKPGRKMGHVTILGEDRKVLIENANTIKNLLIAKT